METKIQERKINWSGGQPEEGRASQYQGMNWADYSFTCEECQEYFIIGSNKEFWQFERLGIDASVLDDWENGFGAPLCLKCLNIANEAGLEN